MKRLAASVLATLILANLYLACSSAPQYEGGGRHVDTIVTGVSTNEIPDSSLDTSVPPDTSTLPDISVPDTTPKG